MNLTPKEHEFLIYLDRTEKFSSLFQEEDLFTKDIGKYNAFTKSLDSIVLNLAEAMKAAKYWDIDSPKNEIDQKHLMSKKSSVMINVVDYLESQHDSENRHDEKPSQIYDDKIISIPNGKKTSDIMIIFQNTGLVNMISKVREKSSKWIECQKSKTATTTEMHPPTAQLKTILENEVRQKGFVLFFKSLECLQKIIEIREMENEKRAIVYFWQNTNFPTKELEPIHEESIETNSNSISAQILNSTCSYQIFRYEDDIDENLEFFDAVDFGSNYEEIICCGIISNLKDNSINYALMLLEDLVKENEKNKGKKLLNPRKIKESLSKLQDAFGLFEKRSKMDLTTFSEHEKKKDLKSFSNILKVLESVTRLVKLQLKEKKLEKESFFDYESAVSMVKGEEGEVQPRNLKEEMNETFTWLKAYSEKAKRLIKEFQAMPKTNEGRNEGADYFSEKKCESFGNYLKDSVDNIEL